MRLASAWANRSAAAWVRIGRSVTGEGLRPKALAPPGRRACSPTWGRPARPLPCRQSVSGPDPTPHSDAVRLVEVVSRGRNSTSSSPPSAAIRCCGGAAQWSVATRWQVSERVTRARRTQVRLVVLQHVGQDQAYRSSGPAGPPLAIFCTRSPSLTLRNERTWFRAAGNRLRRVPSAVCLAEVRL
jgi:hypothetical protein